MVSSLKGSAVTWYSSVDIETKSDWSSPAKALKKTFKVR